MARVSDLLPEVKTHLDSVPDVTAVTYLRRAVKQFCQDTGVWYARTAPVTVNEGDLPDNEDLPFRGTLSNDRSQPYSVDIAFPYVIFALNDVLINNRSSKDPLGKAYPFTYSVIDQSFTVHRDLFGDYPASVVLEVSLQPRKNADQIPDFLVEYRSEGIVSYAIAELMSMPSREWSDPRLAGLYLSKYESRAAEARIRVARRGTTGPIDIAQLPFGG